MTGPEARKPDEGGSPERVTDGAPASPAEVERLQAELAALRGQLDQRERRGVKVHVLRRFIAAALVVLVGFGAAASVVGVWSARTALDTDRWVAAVDDLPSHPEVNRAVATYLTGEIFSVLNVEQRLEDALPPRAAFLAAPATGQVRDYLRGTITKFMQTDRFKELWVTTNRFAHAQMVAILEGRSETVSVRGTTVTINLLPIVNDVLTLVEAQLPTMFGKRLDLPAVSSGEIPAGLRERIQGALGVPLPPNFAQFTFYDRTFLGQLQDGVVQAKRGVTALVAGTLVLLVLAVWISPRRRRTILQLGLWLVVAVVTLSSALRAVRDQLLDQVPSGAYRDAVSTAAFEIFTTLRERGDQLLWLGVAVALIAYLVGPGRLPILLRGAVASGVRLAGRGVRTLAASPQLATLPEKHLDVLRVGGVVVAVVVALLLSSWASLLVVLIVLAAYEGAVTLLARRHVPAAPA